MTATARPEPAPGPHPAAAAGTPSPATPPPSAPRVVPVRAPRPPLAAAGRALRLVLPGVPVPRPVHRPGPRPRRDRPFVPATDFGPELSGRTDLPDPAAAGRQLLTVALEALSGRRPLGQLQRLTTPAVFTALATGRRPRWCERSTSPLVVGPVHVCEPVDGVAEVSAVARRDGRAHAVAARLEGLDGRWRCTALQVG